MPNLSKPLVDQIKWEQLVNLPVATAAGVACCDDNTRYGYWLFSATQFFRFDTWAGTWQQLASPPAGVVAAGSCLTYLQQLGKQRDGKTYGSVMAFRAAGASVALALYDEATNTWGAALSVTNVPAAWGTDGRLICPEPCYNGYLGGYHSNVALNTITTIALAAINATTIAISALPLALPIGARINFGTSAAPIWAVLTAAAAAAATSITVSPLIAAVASGLSAFWYADMFLVGNNATVMYRYNFVANAWTTTSANAATPALPAVPGAVGAGAVSVWLPASGETNALNSLIIVRGGATNTIYEYNLATNAIAAITYYPFTETFGAGTSSSPRDDANGKAKSLLLRVNNSSKIFEFTRNDVSMLPVSTQYLIGEGTAIVGEKMFYMRAPDSTEFIYMGLNTSLSFLRAGLVF